MCIISTASKQGFIEVGTEGLSSGSTYMLITSACDVLKTLYKCFTKCMTHSSLLF